MPITQDVVTVIRASCGDCGDVELSVPDVRVRRCLDDGRSTYVFRCPSCRFPVVKPADARVVELLCDSGVALDEWHLPAELVEGGRGGAPIDHDDLIDFHAMLAGEDWYELLDGIRGR